MSKINSSIDGSNDFDFLHNLFNTLDIENLDIVLLHTFFDLIEERGIMLDDIRLKEMMEKVKKMDGLRKNCELNIDNFCILIQENSTLIKKIFTDNMIIPDFQMFIKEIKRIYEKVKINNQGVNATYIPELAKVNSNLFGVSVCTVDGQRFNIGDTNYGFCLQSCSKPISYLMAVDENGFDKVHKCMGREPSGVEFNKAILKKISEDKEIPHNPMINAGAIMSCSMIEIGKSKADRFNKALDVYKKLAGNTKINYQHATFLSEQAHADRNMCLGFMMKEKNAFLDHIKNANDLFDILDFYFQTCSIEFTCEQLSVLAATLANGGICPITNEKIFESENVKNCLSLMNSCGMYDYSGEWSFKVGIPAKSGVGGGIFLVIPGVMGIATFSPRLDKNGNSVRGIEFAIELTNTFNFHQYDNNLPGICKKINPTLQKNRNNQLNLMNLLFAAYEGDLSEIKKLKAEGYDILSSDYDKRTALHLAASEGKYDVLKYLVNYCKKYGMTDKIHSLDRWERTPLDDAKTKGYQKCIDLLESIKPILNEIKEESES